jgi:hypothetical protein
VSWDAAVLYGTSTDLQRQARLLEKSRKDQALLMIFFL